MRWPRRRGNHVADPDDTQDQRDVEAQQAARDARRRLRAAQADTPRANAHAAHWRRAREKNHFTEMISNLLRSVKP